MAVEIFQRILQSDDVAFPGMVDPAVFAEAMKPYIENPAKMRSVSIYNSEYAKTHFVASVVVRKFENTLKKYIEL